jgi:hypothetical protein
MLRSAVALVRKPVGGFDDLDVGFETAACYFVLDGRNRPVLVVRSGSRRSCRMSPVTLSLTSIFCFFVNLARNGSALTHTT